MIEKIHEKNVWDSLKETDLPIVIYGMGNGADMIIENLQSIGADFADIFASDEFVRGHSFHGKRVLKYSEVQEKYSDFVIVMAFAGTYTLFPRRSRCRRRNFFERIY